jgi:hypothetical protein
VDHPTPPSVSPVASDLPLAAAAAASAVGGDSANAGADADAGAGASAAPLMPPPVPAEAEGSAAAGVAVKGLLKKQASFAWRGGQERQTTGKVHYLSMHFNLVT